MTNLRAPTPGMSDEARDAMLRSFYDALKELQALAALVQPPSVVKLTSITAEVDGVSTVIDLTVAGRIS